MSRLLQSVRRLLRSDDGPTAVEYAVMLSLIIIVCLGGGSRHRYECQSVIPEYRQLHS